jgi:DNA polymerase III epsilon subunit-like protein
MKPKSQQYYISVDVETAGPNPADYALLAIGACTLDEPPEEFYIEIQPKSLAILPEAYTIHQLDPERLQETGVPPLSAMRQFAEWIERVTPPKAQPVCVALNAPFDWMFINDYFFHYLGRNPFGHSALDIKAFYMGLHGVSWDETGYRQISGRYRFQRQLEHNALQDARDQGRLFKLILSDVQAVTP